MHTLCLPVVASLLEVQAGVDTAAVIALLARLAADRTCSQQAALSDAKEALVNSAVDALGAFGKSFRGRAPAGLPAPTTQLRLMPLYVMALLKHVRYWLGLN